MTRIPSAMAADDARAELSEWWRQAAAEAARRDDPSYLFQQLRTRYDELGPDERPVADELLGEWVLSDEMRERYAAAGVANAYGVSAAVPALRELAGRLRSSDAPGADSERSRVENFVRDLESGGEQDPAAGRTPDELLAHAREEIARAREAGGTTGIDTLASYLEATACARDDGELRYFANVLGRSVIELTLPRDSELAQAVMAYANERQEAAGPEPQDPGEARRHLRARLRYELGAEQNRTAPGRPSGASDDELRDAEQLLAAIGEAEERGDDDAVRRFGARLGELGASLRAGDLAELLLAYGRDRSVA